MLHSDGDLIIGRLHNLPLIPLLLVGDELPLFDDIVQEDIDDYIVPGVDFGAYFPAAYDVLGVQRQPGFAAQAL